MTAMTRSLLALAVVAAAPVHAQPSRAEAEAQAEVLFREGRALMARGRLAEACDALDHSQRLAPAVTTLLNLAGCREKLGQLATAWGLFLDAERQTRSFRDDATRQLHAVARDRATRLEARISRLTIAVSTEHRVAGLEIARGDERLDAATWGRALPIDGGTYTITARAPGKQPWSTQVAIPAEGAARTVEIPALRDVPVEAPPRPPPPPPPSNLVPIGLGAGAVVLLAGAIGVDHWAFAAYHDAEAEQHSQSRRDALYDSANTRRYLAGSLAATGAACAGTAAWLYFRHRDRPSSTSAVVVSPTGLAIVGSF
jgi:hypothetical protein